MSDPTDTLRARVEQAQALAAAATPGPMLDAKGWPWTGNGGCCLVCGSWTPAGWDEAHDHRDGCAAEAAHRAFTAARRNLAAAAPDLVALAADLWAEVERLTTERDAAAAKERAAVVAWLRLGASWGVLDDYTPDQAADAIEAGDHLETTDE